MPRCDHGAADYITRLSTNRVQMIECRSTSGLKLFKQAISPHYVTSESTDLIFVRKQKPRRRLSFLPHSNSHQQIVLNF